MIRIWQRIRNEPVFVGSLIIVLFDGLWVFDVIALTPDQFGFINMAVAAVFGAGIRQMTYGPSTGNTLQNNLASATAELDTLREELLDQ